MTTIPNCTHCGDFGEMSQDDTIISRMNDLLDEKLNKFYNKIMSAMDIKLNDVIKRYEFGQKRDSQVDVEGTEQEDSQTASNGYNKVTASVEDTVLASTVQEQEPTCMSQENEFATTTGNTNGHSDSDNNSSVIDETATLVTVFPCDKCTVTVEFHSAEALTDHDRLCHSKSKRKRKLQSNIVENDDDPNEVQGSSRKSLPKKSRESNPEKLVDKIFNWRKRHGKDFRPVLSDAEVNSVVDLFTIEQEDKKIRTWSCTQQSEQWNNLKIEGLRPCKRITSLFTEMGSTVTSLHLEDNGIQGKDVVPWPMKWIFECFTCMTYLHLGGSSLYLDWSISPGNRNGSSESNKAEAYNFKKFIFNVPWNEKTENSFHFGQFLTGITPNLDYIKFHIERDHENERHGSVTLNRIISELRQLNMANVKDLYFNDSYFSTRSPDSLQVTCDLIDYSSFENKFMSLTGFRPPRSFPTPTLADNEKTSLRLLLVILSMQTLNKLDLRDVILAPNSSILQVTMPSLTWLICNESMFLLNDQNTFEHTFPKLQEFDIWSSDALAQLYKTNNRKPSTEMWFPPSNTYFRLSHPELQVLKLSFNRSVEFPTTFLEGFPLLKHVELHLTPENYKNELFTFLRQMQNHAHLDSLALSASQISSVPMKSVLQILAGVHRESELHFSLAKLNKIRHLNLLGTNDEEYDFPADWVTEYIASIKHLETFTLSRVRFQSVEMDQIQPILKKRNIQFVTNDFVSTFYFY